MVARRSGGASRSGATSRPASHRRADVGGPSAADPAAGRPDASGRCTLGRAGGTRAAAPGANQPSRAVGWEPCTRLGVGVAVGPPSCPTKRRKTPWGDRRVPEIGGRARPGGAGPRGRRRDPGGARYAALGRCPGRGRDTARGRAPAPYGARWPASPAPNFVKLTTQARQGRADPASIRANRASARSGSHLGSRRSSGTDTSRPAGMSSSWPSSAIALSWSPTRA